MSGGGGGNNNNNDSMQARWKSLFFRLKEKVERWNDGMEENSVINGEWIKSTEGSILRHENPSK